ncbi:Ribosomal protein L35 [Zea mays]|uniref:Ribosomal protein L35 n=1 Tax=Zea mays TaxID=4577 RepID=A0A1D6KA89_MAIZE|nr:Ribosomal protein L35 [Zea mays]
MRRWWCAAGGLARCVLSSSTSAIASHARPLPAPLMPKSPSFTVPFSLSCRRHHSLQGFFHLVIASSFRPPSKEAKRRLRKPALVHLAYAKVIKKLNFCG